MSFEAYEPELNPPTGTYDQSKQCRNTTIYCILSVALLIASGAINNPLVMDLIPGGQATMILLTLLIVLGVLILCIWQFPRYRRPS